MLCMELPSPPLTKTTFLLMKKLKVMLVRLKILRFYTHNRSFTVRDPEIQTSLSNHIWELKDDDVNYLITWQILEKSKSFNPITLQCHLCLSEICQLLNPNSATLNTRSETYGCCRHRKKFLLENVKPLALIGGALTYRYKR